MSAQNYPVTQGYGYDPTYPTADHFHKGIDYGCPMQTAVVVNGVQIGLSGNSGFVTGPHLHVGRWIGSVHTNPGVGNGFNFGDAVVTEVSEDATNGKYVRVQGDGASWVYLHLFEQTCHVGQRLSAAVPQAPAPLSNESHVYLPASVSSWAAYHVGSGLRKGTADQIGSLLPSKYGGLSYAIKRWVGDYAVVVDTQDFGEVTLWVKNTDASFNNGKPAVAPVLAPAPPPPPPPPPPAAPLTAPNTETYDLIKELDGYLTSNQAINHINPQVKIAAGSYFVFNKRFANDNLKDKLIAINVTKTAGKAGAWVNPDDNSNSSPAAEVAATPEPKSEEPPKPELSELYKPFDKDGNLLSTPQIYVAMKDLSVVDLSGVKKTITMPKYSVTYMSGTVELDGVKYAIPKTAYEKGFWYAIEWFDRATKLANLELESDVFNAKTTVTEREATRNLKPLDRVALAVEHSKKILLGFAGLFSKIKIANKNKN